MRRTAILLGLLCACTAPLHEPPPLDEIFRRPEVVRPRRFAFSPDGRTLTFLLARGPGEVSDLWAYDLETGERRVLLRAGGVEQLTDEEQGARERRRERGTGIAAYHVNPKDETILVPLSGDLHLLRDGRLERLTRTKGAERNPRWSPDGKAIAYVRDGNLHVLRDGVETRLTDRGRDKIRCGLAEFVAMEELGRHDGFWWSKDSRFLAYVHTDARQVPIFHMHDYLDAYGKSLPQEYPRAGDPNVVWTLCVVPAAGGEPREMRVDDEYLVRVDWMPDGGLAVQVADRPQRKLILYRCDPATGDARVLLEETDERWVAFHRNLRFLEDGRFLWTSERTGWNHLYVSERAGLRPLTVGAWDVAGIVHVDEQRGRVTFTAWEGAPLEQRLYRVRLDGTALEQLSESGLSLSASASKDGRWRVSTFSSASFRPVSVVEGPGGEQLLTALEDATIGIGPPPQPEYLTVPAADGTPLRAMLYRSPSSGRRPVILHVYGGPGSRLVQNRWGGSTGLWHRRMALRGYHVLAVDNRGCGGYGRDVCRSVSGRLCHIEVQDQVAAARWLARQPWADPSRIGIWGWSYGGTMALMCLLEAPQVFAAGAAVAPVTDWRDYDTAYTERYLGLPLENPDGYSLSSPITKADTLERPLLLAHGLRDDNVHARNALAFLDRAQRAGRLIETDFYPRGAHGIGDEDAHKLLFRRMERFWDRHLGR